MRRDPLSGWPKPQLLQQVLKTGVAMAAVEFRIDPQHGNLAITAASGPIEPAYAVILIAQCAVDDG